MIVVLLIPLIGLLLLGLAWPIIKMTVGRDDDIPADTGSKGKTQQKEKSKDRPKEERVRFPYRYADQHLFVHNNSVWTGVRLTPVTDEYLTQAELDDLVVQATKALSELARGDDPVEVQTRLTYRPVTAHEWADQLLESCWNPSRMYRQYVRRIASYLTLTRTSRPEVYMFVKVGQVGKNAEVGVADSINATITGTADEQFNPHVVAQWASQAIEIHEKLEPIGAVPTNREDLLWVIRKTLHGHLTPGPAEFAVSRPWGSGEFQMLVDFHGTNRKTHVEIHHINETDESAEIGEDITSYSMCLVAAEWPEEIVFRQDTAWLRFIANLGAQIEVSYRLSLLPTKTFKDRVKKIHGNLEEEANDMAKTGRSDDTLEDQVDTAKGLLRDVENKKLPGTEAQIMLMISADSYERLEILRREVTNAVKRHLDITLVRPRRYQWRMLESFLPGQPKQLPSVPYVRLQEVETFGVALPNAGTEVGDNPKPDRTGQKMLGWRGDYIGQAGEVPVHYSLHVGPARNSGGGMAIIGASGGGKSSLALLKFFQESESGVRCVVLDPKVDFAAFCYYLSFGSQVNDPDFNAEAAAGTLGDPDSKFQPINPEFWNETQIIDVVKSAAGVLDPWQVARTVEEGELLAETMLSMFLGEREYNRCQTYIVEALQAVKTKYEGAYNEAVAGGMSHAKATAELPRPTLWAVVEYVDQQYREAQALYDESGGTKVTHETLKDVRQVATTLTQLRGLPYARLAFAENPKGLGVLRKRRTVFTLRGIETPKQADPAKWSKPQRLAATVLYTMVRLSAQMLDVDPERHPRTGEMAMRPKALFVDEAYVVTSIESGRELLLQTLAQGRSYGLVTVIIDQQARRLAQIEESGATEGTGNQFHSVFAFLQKTLGEARAVLPLLGRENHDGVARALQHQGKGGQLDTGICLFRDVDMRVATTEVSLVFRELHAATDTNPNTRPERQSQDPSPDVDDWSFISSEDINEAVEAAQDLINRPDYSEDDSDDSEDAEGDTDNGVTDTADDVEVTA